MIIMGLTRGGDYRYAFVAEQGGNLPGSVRAAFAPARILLPLRLEHIYEQVLALAAAYRPEAWPWKNFLVNTRTALQVGEARGTVIRRLPEQAGAI